MIGLEQCANWSIHPARYFGEMVELTLSQIAKNDAKMLEAIEGVIAGLE